MSKKKLVSKLLFISTAFVFVFISLASAQVNVDIERLSSGEVLVIGTDKPATFDLKITNNGPSTNFEFYNLLGFAMEPKSISIGSGATKEVTLELTPVGEVEERGYYTITYYIKRSESQQEQFTLPFKIIEINEAFTIGSGYLDPESKSVEVFIKNMENVDFGDVKVKFDSPFFTADEDLTIGPNEIVNFPIDLDSEDLQGTLAGFYTMTAEIEVDGEKAFVEGVVRFTEKNIVTTSRTEFGFLVNTQIIEKKNDGNVVERTETIVKKNVIPRLFTSFSPEPDIVDREGASVYYTWIREVMPGEVLEIRVRTNWLFPFVIVLFLVIIVLLTRKYTETSLVMRKKVTFVRAKGGEFALKVSVFLSSNKYIERVNVIDRLPPLVEVYERFGGEQPSRVDSKNKKIEWNFQKLEPGEKRTLSYVIYSKIGVLGRFALPPATAIYEREGEIHEAASNRAFFVAEQRAKRDDED